MYEYVDSGYVDYQTHINISVIVHDTVVKSTISINVAKMNTRLVVRADGVAPLEEWAKRGLYLTFPRSVDGHKRRAIGSNANIVV